MIKDYNDNVMSKKAFMNMFPAKRELNHKTFSHIKRKYQRGSLIGDLKSVQFKYLTFNFCIYLENFL